MSRESGAVETMGGVRHYYLFQAAGHRLAVPLEPVERLVRAVEITPLPNAARGTAGMINVQGQAVPVLDLRYWLEKVTADAGSRPEVQPKVSDHFILLRRNKGLVALWADSVEGVAQRKDSDVMTSPGVRWDEGQENSDWKFLKMEEGLVPVCDVDGLLAVAPEDLQSFLAQTGEGMGG